MNQLLVGYARVSTEQQDLTAQRNNLAARGVGDDRIYFDRGLTGTNRDRPGMRLALAPGHSGDTLGGDEARSAGPVWVNLLIDTGERLGVLTDVWSGMPYLASVA